MQDYALVERTRTSSKNANFKDATRGIRFVTPAGSPYDDETLAFIQKSENDARTRKITPIAWTIPSGWTRVGKGAHGTVYRATYDEAFSKFVDSFLNDGLYSLKRAYPKVGSTVLVKIASREPNERFNGFITPVLHEAYVHSKLSSRTECFAPCSVRMCVADVIPEFYASFLIPHPGKEVYCTIMEFVEGATVMKHLQKQGMRVSAELYVDIEKTVVSMWSSGISHADMHLDNLMITKDGAKIMAIDFGFAVLFPEKLWLRIMNLLKKYVLDGGSRSVADVWDDTEGGLNITNLVNSTIKARVRTTWYNADKAVLKFLYNKIPKNDRARLREVRLRAWGCSEPQSQPVPKKTLSFESIAYDSSKHATTRTRVLFSRLNDTVRIATQTTQGSQWKTTGTFTKPFPMLPFDAESLFRSVIRTTVVRLGENGVVETKVDGRATLDHLAGLSRSVAGPRVSKADFEQKLLSVIGTTLNVDGLRTTTIPRR